jgi:hypothetical protein
MYALVLFDLDPGATEDTRRDTINRIRSVGPPNAKQLILATTWLVKDEVLIELSVSGTTGNDLNVALAPFAEIPGVKSLTVVHIIARS